MTRELILALAMGGVVGLMGCNSGGEAPEAAPEGEEAEAPAEEGTDGVVAEQETDEATDEAPAEPAEPVLPTPENIVLVEMAIPMMHSTLMVPEGMELTRETETGAGLSLDVGNYNSILVSMEPHGVDSEDRARSMGGHRRVSGCR